MTDVVLYDKFIYHLLSRQASNVLYKLDTGGWEQVGPSKSRSVVLRLIIQLMLIYVFFLKSKNKL